jgi:hypothetical protein
MMMMMMMMMMVMMTTTTMMMMMMMIVVQLVRKFPTVFFPKVGYPAAMSHVLYADP